MTIMAIHCKNVNQINQDLARTRKLLIGVGCSFTEGWGAWDMELVEEYPPGHNGLMTYLTYDYETKKKIVEKYSDCEMMHDEIDTSKMTHRNSYINRLASHYYGDSWTPVNLGVTACGNFSGVARLFMYGIDYDTAEEITVIFCPTGMQRFDLLNDSFHNTNLIGDDFKTLFLGLGTRKVQGDQHWRNMNEGYYRSVWSTKFEIMHTVMCFQMLASWCKLRNARLVVVPAFDKNYNREYFAQQLSINCFRDSQTYEIQDWEPGKFSGPGTLVDKLDCVPWNCFFRPGGYPTFYHLALAQETKLDQNLDMVDIIKTKQMTPDNWITGCGHPSAKAHDLFARLLYNHLEGIHD